jgi:MFS family permease
MTEAPPPDQPRPWYNRTVFGLGIVSLLTDVHSEAILALLPQFMRDVLGLQMAGIGFIEGMAEATVAGFNLVSGWLSDKFAVRKPIMIAGYSISTAVKVLLVWATLPWQVLVVRMGDRVGKGVRTPPRDALLADAVNPAQWGRAYGFHRAMDSAGAVAGTGLGWGVFALTQSYSKAFAIAAAFGVLAVVSLVTMVREPERRERPTTSRPPISFRGLPTAFWLFVAAWVVFSAGRVTYAFFLLRVKDLGVPDAMLPGVYLLHNVVYTLMAVPAGVVSDRITAKWATLLTFVLMAALALGLALAGTAWLGIALTAGYGIVLASQGASVRAWAVKLVPAHMRASGIAVYSALGLIAQLPGGLVVGLMWDHSGAASGWFLAALLAALGALMVLAVPHRLPDPTPPS